MAWAANGVSPTPTASSPRVPDVALLHRSTGLRGRLWKFTGELVVLKDSKGRQHTFEHQPARSPIRARP